MCTKNTTAHQLKNGRLPKTVVPTHYDLAITPNLEKASFTGKETIVLSVKEPVSCLQLNTVEIVIDSVVIRHEDGTRLVGQATHDEEKQLATITFEGTVGTGEWFLDLSFTGILNNKLRGFYRSTYKGADGSEKLVAVTKFEPSDARRAFPCWDEPCFKADYKISLVVDEHLTAISNSKIESVTALPNGKKLVSFKPTIKMSSYLVAYMVGEFESSEPALSGDCEIRIWSVPGKKHLHAFALKVAKFSLDYFGNYFGIAYPSEKLDLIAIPDFASGAMENYGAITYRETSLLLDEKSASRGELIRVADTVSHENAHMWFGDLVTMDWWNGLWLNEAFATFMAAKCVDAFKPEWKFWDGFNIDKAAAFRVDGLHSSRSIEFPVVSPEDARAMFDVLTYDKGAAILRMQELLIGEETFRKGCALYMKRHAYGNTQTEDLWQALEEAVKADGKAMPIRKMMDGWVFYKGYPIVVAELSTVSGCVTLSQKPFHFLKKSIRTNQWIIPVSLRAETRDGVVEKTVLLDSDSNSFYLGEGLQSVVVNCDGNGFFRVSYSDSLREKLLDNPGLMSVSERFNLASDLWASVQCGNLSMPNYLSALGTLCTIYEENDPNVWSVILGSLNTIRRILPAEEEEVADGFLNLVRSLVLPKLRKLGWTPASNESSESSRLRSMLIGCLGALGDQAALAHIKELYESYKANRSSVDANLVPTIIDSMAVNGNAALYEEFIALKDNAATPQEESRFLYALASFPETSLIQRTLADTLNGKIRTQDAPAMIRSLFFNRAGDKLTWLFVRDNWDKLVAAFPLQGIIRLCDGVSAIVCPEGEAEVRKFYAEHKVKGAERAMDQALELMAIVNTLAQRESGDLSDILLTGYSCV